jgi:multiple sugar transport system ATP-binding protein
MGQRIVVMRTGAIQQVGPPQAVYDHPVNTFVAAFLGSPRINLHAGSLLRDGDSLAFANADVRISLPARVAARAGDAAGGGEVALGVRPEDIAVVLDGGAADAPVMLPATVALVEPVGSDLFVNATTGGTTWMARTDPRLPVRPGQSVRLVLNLDNAHLFGADGRNLATP